MTELTLTVSEPSALDLSLDEQGALTLAADGYVGSAYSPTVDVSEVEGGHSVSITSKRGTSIVTDTFEVLDGATGPSGADGRDGIDGTPCTHSWDGSVLSVTSASGTSSADLRGPQGPQGETYELTQADIEAIAELVTSRYIVAEGVGF